MASVSMWSSGSATMRSRHPPGRTAETDRLRLPSWKQCSRPICRRTFGAVPTLSFSTCRILNRKGQRSLARSEYQSVDQQSDRNDSERTCGDQCWSGRWQITPVGSPHAVSSIRAYETMSRDCACRRGRSGMRRQATGLRQTTRGRRLSRPIHNKHS
jgi:hypothetical protein